MGSVDRGGGLVLRLDGRPSSVAEARRFVRRLAPGLGADEDAQDTIIMLVSELVTNAVLHARTSVVLGLADIGSCLRVTVTDGSPLMPRRRRATRDAALETTGRGLQMLDALAAESGVEPDDGVATGGKTVWFVVAKSDAPEVPTPGLSLLGSAGARPLPGGGRA